MCPARGKHQSHKQDKPDKAFVLPVKLPDKYFE
jgi:hypothetical protein